MDKNTLTLPLLEFLANRLRCAYLSDLPRVSGEQLAQELRRIPAEAAGLREWNDALAYLTGEPPAETAERARERLLAVLQLPAAGEERSTEKAEWPERRGGSL